MARGAQEFLLQSDFHYKVLHGKQVPTRFTHRTSGVSLNVPLPQSSLSKKILEFEGCVILDLGSDIQYYHMTIFVHWKFRGVTGICRIKPVTLSCAMDHQVVFHFDIDKGDEIDDPPSQLDCNGVEFEFEHHSFEYCSCYSINKPHTCQRSLQTCPIFPEEIKGCGIRVMSVSPYQSREELDAEIENSKKQTKESSLDQEIAGSVKKRGLEGGALGPSSSTPLKKLRRTHSPSSS